MESVGTLIPFLLILFVFWLLIIRPARSRQRAQQQLQDQLAAGQQVMTTSGLFARVAALEDDAIVLEPSPGVTLRYARQAVARVLPDDEPPSAQVDDAGRTEDAFPADQTRPADGKLPTDDRKGTERPDQTS